MYVIGHYGASIARISLFANCLANHAAYEGDFIIVERHDRVLQNVFRIVIKRTNLT